jgi:hypothetical protein
MGIKEILVLFCSCLKDGLSMFKWQVATFQQRKLAFNQQNVGRFMKS